MNKFERGKKYRIILAWESDANMLFRLKEGVCYSLSVGDVVTFRGKNLGLAEFRTSDGKLVMLKPRVAFKIMVETADATSGAIPQV